MIHSRLGASQASRVAGSDSRDLEIKAAALKARASRFAVDTLQECRESCGGQGYLAENRLGELRADADIFTTFEGDNTVLRLLVAKGLLSGLKRQLKGLGAIGLVRYVANIAAREAIAHNPLQIRRHDAEHLGDVAVQLGALNFREEHLLRSLAARVKRRLDEGLGPFDAFSQVQDHALALADAWTDVEVLAAMVALVEAFAIPDQLLGPIAQA